MTRQYFGTDGVRGKVGEYPITADFALRLGWATGKALAGAGNKKVLIGKDTRISGYMFESALEAGLIAAGVDAVLLGPMPTPGIAYLTQTFRACAGIVISASHNPYFDNGIKFFSDDGSKLDDEIELQIEYWLNQTMSTVATDQLGKARRLNDARGRYIEFCKSSVPRNLSLKGLKIVLDCANGATYNIAPAVFEELGAKVITTAASPDGININYQCGSTHPEKLRDIVLEQQADLGIAFDGDGDRVVMIDRFGHIIDGDQIIYILASQLKKQGLLEGGVVGTLMSNLGLEQALSQLDIPFLRSDVGDRHVMAMLKENNWQLGGESSGHIICREFTSTGDGIIAALQVLVNLVRANLELHQALEGLEIMPQVLINVSVAKRMQPMKNQIIKQAVKVEENLLKNRGRVLLRASGTEPLIRIMVEGVEMSEISASAERLAEIVRNI